MIFTLLGVASGLLIIIGDIPYVIDTLKGKTKPHRVTWFIVFILNLIAFANQSASGATNSLWLVVGGIIATFMVFTTSLLKGVGGYEKLDVISLVGAFVGLLLWWQFDSPVFSIVANIVVASLALAPTYKKAYLNPDSETKVTWLIGSISALLGTISVGKIDFVLLLLPVFSFVVQAGVFAVLQVRGKD